MTAILREALGLAVCALVALSVNLPAAAQEAVRDPTIAPAENGNPVLSPAGVEGMTVLVREDKPYLMVGARLYAPGDKIGNLRIQRITEKEIWFHDGSALIKAPRFAGIERKAAVTKPPCTASTKRPAPNAAPCEDTQP